jgi:hypothetical protein
MIDARRASSSENMTWPACIGLVREKKTVLILTRLFGIPPDPCVGVYVRECGHVWGMTYACVSVAMAGV